MSKFGIERQDDLYDTIGRIIGIPDPSRTSVRKHGIILILTGLASTTLLTVVSRTAFFGELCSNLTQRMSRICLDVSPPIAVFSCFASFITLSVLGLGVVELITTTPWNKAEGRTPFLTLVFMWIAFVGVLCGIIIRDFGV